MDAQGSFSDLARGVKVTLDEMNTSLSRNAMDEFIRHLDSEGAKRTKQWYDGANDSEREIYRRKLVQQRPFFLIDASPLLVVYAKMPDNTMQVMYFTNIGNNLRWTNSTHITIVDKVFKAGPLAKAALLEKPFSELAVK